MDSFILFKCFIRPIFYNFLWPLNWFWSQAFWRFQNNFSAFIYSELTVIRGQILLSIEITLISIFLHNLIPRFAPQGTLVNPHISLHELLFDFNVSLTLPKPIIPLPKLGDLGYLLMLLPLHPLFSSSQLFIFRPPQIKLWSRGLYFHFFGTILNFCWRFYTSETIDGVLNRRCSRRRTEILLQIRGKELSGVDDTLLIIRLFLFTLATISLFPANFGYFRAPSTGLGWLSLAYISQINFDNFSSRLRWCHCWHTCQCRSCSLIYFFSWWYMRATWQNWQVIRYIPRYFSIGLVFQLICSIGDCLRHSLFVKGFNNLLNPFFNNLTGNPVYFFLAQFAFPSLIQLENHILAELFENLVNLTNNNLSNFLHTLCHFGIEVLVKWRV